jgi:hypothetical protein
MITTATSALPHENRAPAAAASNNSCARTCGRHSQDKRQSHACLLPGQTGTHTTTKEQEHRTKARKQGYYLKKEKQRLHENRNTETRLD